MVVFGNLLDLPSRAGWAYNLPSDPDRRISDFDSNFALSHGACVLQKESQIMWRSLWRSLVTVSALSCFLFLNASGVDAANVHDAAGFFSSTAIQHADEKIAEIHRRS